MTSLNLGAASLKVLATVDHPSLAVSCMLPDGTVVPETAVDFKVSDDFVQNYSLVRCTMELPFEWTSTTTGTNLRESESLQLWEERILDSNTRLYAPPHSSVVGNVGIRTVQPFHIQRPATDYGTLIDKPSWDAAPSVFVNKSSLTKCFTTLHLDVLAYASIAPNDGMPSMQDTQGLKKSLVEQLRSCINVIESRMEQGYGIPQAIQAYHFLPPGYLHHVTVVYPFAQQAVYVDSTNENDLLDIRKSLHRALGLPMDRPLLRVVQSMNETEFANGKKVHEAGGNRLLNVHQGLSPSGIQGGSVHTIAGSYEYFHYMQDRFDDCGWGCAYRSLQTICSWFQKQRYIGRDPPTHKEIQTTLVKLGDKPAEFVGSRQWIGAIELGFVLETLIGVESKILTVSSGDDMPSKARELCAHFDSQGTPVMIGGGVLAYTLLGVHYNQDTGDCAFLILDPHYTGVDDGSKVRAGQWVAWKRAGEKAAAGGDLFVSGAFYNILCPQRPVTV